MPVVANHHSRYDALVQPPTSRRVQVPSGESESLRGSFQGAPRPTHANLDDPFDILVADDAGRAVFAHQGFDALRGSPSRASK